MDPTTNAHIDFGRTLDSHSEAPFAAAVPLPPPHDPSNPGAPLSSSLNTAPTGLSGAQPSTFASEASSFDNAPSSRLSNPPSSLSNPPSGFESASTRNAHTGGDIAHIGDSSSRIGSTNSASTGVNKPSTTSSTTSKSTATPASPTATKLRQRVNSLSSQLDQTTRNVAEHPAVQNAKVGAQKQVGQFREQLGRSPLLRDLEKRTGVDRVLLVAGGALAYLILIPLNLFGLAFPTTNLLTFIPPLLLALQVLDSKESRAKDDKTKSLLAYFVVFGYVQFLETFIGGVLARRVPQYFTVKLLFLAYLLHPRTKGALQIHDSVFRPLLAKANSATSYTNPTTPPTSKPSTSNVGTPIAGQFSSAGTGSQFSSAGTGSQFSNAGTGSQFSSGGTNSQFPGAGNPSQFSSAGTTAHLPSGGGNGVGLEVRADGNITRGSSANEGFSVLDEAR